MVRVLGATEPIPPTISQNIRFETIHRKALLKWRKFSPEIIDFRSLNVIIK